MSGKQAKLRRKQQIQPAKAPPTDHTPLREVYFDPAQEYPLDSLIPRALADRMVEAFAGRPCYVAALERSRRQIYDIDPESILGASFACLLCQSLYPVRTNEPLSCWAQHFGFGCGSCQRGNYFRWRTFAEHYLTKQHQMEVTQEFRDNSVRQREAGLRVWCAYLRQGGLISTLPSAPSPTVQWAELPSLIWKGDTNER